MRLKVIQKAHKGILGKKEPVKIQFVYLSNNYILEIIQNVTRTVMITCEGNIKYNDIIEVYYSIESLLMLFDGQFYEISEVNDGTDITVSFLKKRLACYKSADFMLYTGNILIDYTKVINDELIIKWISFRNELDLIHKMFLYCTSNIEMTVDMKCAFMIEIYEADGLKKLTKKENNITFKKANQRGMSQLKLDLLKYIEIYGANIFEKENEKNICNLADKLKQTRHRIAHIKSEQKNYLNGSECVMYLMKLSLMYRVILFHLLNINESFYSEQLKKRIGFINKQKAMVNFLSKLDNVSS